MKVVQLPHAFLPSLGGTELYAFRMARDLRREGLACVVVSSAQSRLGGAGAALVHGIPVTYLPSRRLLPRNPFLFGLRAALAGVRPDVVHLHSLWHLCALQACAAKRALGYAIVNSMHGVLPDVAAPALRLFQRTFRPAAQFVADRSDLIVVLNQAERRKLLEAVRVDEGRVRLVEAGIDVAEPDPDTSQRLRRELGSYLFFSGRIIPDKHPELALAAFAAVAAARPALKLLLLGPVEAGYRARLLRRAGPLAGRVIFREPLDPVAEARPLASHYACAEASFALGGLEGQPTRLLESMMHGVPVIAFPAGGVRDLVRDGETGWLAEALDAGVVTAALRRHLEATAAQRERISRGARAMVRTSLWADKQVRLRALLEEAAALARSRRRRA